MTVIVNSPPARAPWTTATTLMVLAVIISGMAASVTVSPVFFVTTIFMMGILTRAARAEAAERRSGSAKSDFLDLPEDLRRVVDDSLAAVPEGDARRLLLGVIVQARPILASRSTTFDAAAESASRTNVESLVAACCGTAIDLARLDAASKPAVARDSSVDARLSAARDMLVRRMSDATSALAALYAAGLQHGTPASNRVAELASEIDADAKARGAAASEIGQLLGDRRPETGDR